MTSSSSSNVISKLALSERLDDLNKSNVSNGNGNGNGNVNNDDQNETNQKHTTAKKIEESIIMTTMQQKKVVSASKVKINDDNESNDGNVGIGGSDTKLNKASDVLSSFSITKLPPPEMTMQRPLKPQSEMDFSVPYNIINNYFSVGVVSTAIKFSMYECVCVAFSSSDASYKRRTHQLRLIK